MKKFFPGIFDHSRSLLIDHLFALLIALVLTNIINFFNSNGIPALQLILSCSVYFAITYSDSWHRGVAAGNKIRAGVIRRNWYSGFYAGLLASIPGFVLALAAYCVESDFCNVYDVFGVDIFTSLNRFWQLPFSPLYLLVNEKPAFNLIFPFFLPVFSEIGYIMGLKGYTLKKYFLYKNSEDNWYRIIF